jgi:putative addiction module killer protein
MKQTIVIYEQKRGKSIFLDWLLHLKDVKARAVIRARINRLELGNFGDCKSVGTGVLELRVSFGPGYRIYFGRDGNTLVVLLCGGDKGSQAKDIQKAKLLWKEYKDASKKL